MSKIEWTGETWNPIVGCSKASAGCANCYAEQGAARNANFGIGQYKEVVTISPDASSYMAEWNGRTFFVSSQMVKPVKRKKPQTYFVNSMGDTFHENTPDEWIDRVFVTMALCQRHTFQLLTKRIERAAKYFMGGYQARVARILAKEHGVLAPAWPLPNVWLGCTVENQEMVDRRLPALCGIAAARRFVSVEPMLGPVVLPSASVVGLGRAIHWVICGGESGHHARPVHPQWVRNLKYQCDAMATPFFFKQWGEWQPIGPGGSTPLSELGTMCSMLADGTVDRESLMHGSQLFVWRGKAAAGRLLDGVEYLELPTASGQDELGGEL